MAETKVNVTDALRGQQEQLKRLLAQKIWVSEASKETSKATLSDIAAQISELKRLLDQLDAEIRDRLAQKP